MFDKMLCRMIKKRTITVYDVAEAYGCYVMRALSVLAVFGLVTIAASDGTIQSMKSAAWSIIVVCAVAVCIILGVIYAMSKLFDLVVWIAHIEVAHCPNNPVIAEVPDHSPEGHPDRNPKCSFSNVCESGLQCNYPYSECPKKKAGCERNDDGSTGHM